MAAVSKLTTEIQLRLDRLRAGDYGARQELLVIVGDRLTRLARKMLKNYPGVQRWEQTDDVLQNAAVRLHRALENTTPESARGFFNLAAVRIRRELIDLVRHYSGPEGMGRHHDSRAAADGSAERPNLADEPAHTDDPVRLASWTEFHGQIDALPDEHKEVFHLLWYQGLKQAEAAALLGVTERVVKYRWRSARLRLHELLDGRLPG